MKTKYLIFLIIILSSCEATRDYSERHPWDGLPFPNYCGENFTGLGIEYLDINLNPTGRESAVAYRYVQCWNSKLIHFPSRNKWIQKVKDETSLKPETEGFAPLDGTYKMIGVSKLENDTSFIIHEEYSNGFMLSQKWYLECLSDSVMISYYDWQQGIGQYTHYWKGSRESSWALLPDGSQFIWEKCFKGQELNKGVPPPDSIILPLAAQD